VSPLHCTLAPRPCCCRWRPTTALPRCKPTLLHRSAVDGAGSQGMQRNPGCPSIEEELERAFVKAGAIPPHLAGSFQGVGECVDLRHAPTGELRFGSRRRGLVP
jgi:hypothetical protein